MIQRNRQPLGGLDSLVGQLGEDLGNCGAVVVTEHNIRLDDHDFSRHNSLLARGARQDLLS